MTTKIEREDNGKKGRFVIGFKFTVKEKPKPKLIAPERDQKTYLPVPSDEGGGRQT